MNAGFDEASVGYTGGVTRDRPSQKVGACGAGGGGRG